MRIEIEESDLSESDPISIQACGQQQLVAAWCARRADATSLRVLPLRLRTSQLAD